MSHSEQPKLTDRQLATILHALRMLQESETHNTKACTNGKCAHFADVEEMDNEEIDKLCESLNMGSDIEENESRYTNHYLCPDDNTRWDDDWSCMSNDRCPTCNHEIEPYASTDNNDNSETIHAQDVYDRANSLDGGEAKG